MLLCQFAFRSQVGEELTAWNVGHQEVEVARVLREPLQADLKFFNYNSFCTWIGRAFNTAFEAICRKFNNKANSLSEKGSKRFL